MRKATGGPEAAPVVLLLLRTVPLGKGTGMGTGPAAAAPRAAAPAAPDDTAPVLGGVGGCKHCQHARGSASYSVTLHANASGAGGSGLELTPAFEVGRALAGGGQGALRCHDDGDDDDGSEDDEGETEGAEAGAGRGGCVVAGDVVLAVNGREPAQWGAGASDAPGPPRPPTAPGPSAAAAMERELRTSLDPLADPLFVEGPLKAADAHAKQARAAFEDAQAATLGRFLKGQREEEDAFRQSQATARAALIAEQSAAATATVRLWRRRGGGLQVLQTLGRLVRGAAPDSQAGAGAGEGEERGESAEGHKQQKQWARAGRWDALGRAVADHHSPLTTRHSWRRAQARRSRCGTGTICARCTRPRRAR